MRAPGSQHVKYICKCSQSVCTILSYPTQPLYITIILSLGMSSIGVNSLISVLSISSLNKLPILPTQ